MKPQENESSGFVAEAQKLFHHLTLTSSTTTNTENNNNDNTITVTAKPASNTSPVEDGSEVKSASGSEVTRVIWDKIKHKVRSKL